jgi:hypothetical protein
MPAFDSREDSIGWERARAAAARARGLHVVVSLHDRQVWVIRDGDTLVRADAAVASGARMEFGKRAWTFQTPRGRHVVLRKVRDPVWTPPDWMYAEAALEHGLELATLRAATPVRLRDGSSLVVRGDRVGIRSPDSRRVDLLPLDEHIVFDGTLYIPPVSTRNRQVPGELGRYALDLGDGYLIHGTPDASSIGRAVTHGCIRLGDRDITWLYRHVPVGTAVYIY